MSSPGRCPRPEPSVLVVPPHLDGLPPCVRHRLVASCKRPWGPPRFRPAVTSLEARSSGFPAGAFTLQSIPLSPSRAAHHCGPLPPRRSPAANWLDLEALLRVGVRCARPPFPVTDRPWLSWASLPEVLRCVTRPKSGLSELVDPPAPHALPTTSSGARSGRPPAGNLFATPEGGRLGPAPWLGRCSGSSSLRRHPQPVGWDRGARRHPASLQAARPRSADRGRPSMLYARQDMVSDGGSVSRGSRGSATGHGVPPKSVHPRRHRACSERLRSPRVLASGRLRPSRSPVLADLCRTLGGPPEDGRRATAPRDMACGASLADPKANRAGTAWKKLTLLHRVRPAKHPLPEGGWLRVPRRVCVPPREAVAAPGSCRRRARPRRTRPSPAAR